MYWSGDDGQHWNSLQRNLPVTSVRDIDVHGDDLVVATHGRSFWILDDIAPLRQQAAARQAKESFLYAPSPAVRVDNDAFLGTPLPPEEPQAKNPPDGAILDYVLAHDAQKVQLRIYDASHKLLRQFSSGETPKGWPSTLPIAERWFPVPQVLARSKGEHRFVWDLAAGSSGLSTGDDDEDDAGAPPGPRVVPGVYTVELIVDGKTEVQPLTITMDPRGTSTTENLNAQFALGQRVYTDAQRTRRAMAEIQSVSSELTKLQGSGPREPEVQAELAKAQRRLREVTAGIESGDTGSAMGLSATSSGLGAVLRVIESGHRAVPASSVEAYDTLKGAADRRTAEWAEFKTKELPALNQRLQHAGQKPIQVGAIEEAVSFAMTR